MSLVDTLKQRVFDLVDSVQPASRYKVLVIDKHVQRIFSYILDKSELLNRQVSSVELLDSRRQTQGYMEAVYIMKPDSYTLDCLIADFTRMPNRYSGAYLFFLPGLTKDMHRKITNSNVGRFIRKLEVTYLDYFPLESQVFTLDDPCANEVFFNSECFGLVKPEVSKIASRLVSVCAALGEYPIVRFQKANENYNASILPFMVAKEFQDELDAYARDHRDFPNVHENRPRSQFIIFDRSIDPFAPLLHEFTYQAMAYDLLPIRDTNKFSYKSEKSNGTSEMVDGVLTDKDSEWVSLRHLHMQDAIDTLTSKLDKFKKENPHLVDSSSKANVTDLQDMIANLPVFTEMKDRFALHLQMANECMNTFQKKNLNGVAEVEQTCATGVGGDGRKNKNLTDDVVQILMQDTLERQDKVRILALYALYRGGLIKEDYKKLQQHCGLDEFDLQVIENFGIIGSQTVKDSLKKEKFQDKVQDKLHKGPNPGQPMRFHGQATGDVYDTSRFVPGIKNIVDQLSRSALDSKLFPYTKDEPTADGDLEAHSSLRNPRQRAAWATPRSTSNQVKQRIFVFVIGGVTLSEARSMYELSKQHGKEFIIGGSNLLTPGHFLSAMGRLTAPRNRLKLPQDQPLPRAPGYLMENDRETRQATAASAAQPKPSASATKIPPNSSTGSINSALKDPSQGMGVQKKEKKKFKLFK